ncbi:MAG: hypothetical protein K6B45_08885 [Bacteroidaceae bacterium]|nr:hypothetical protein [Bacteroidaceae bacterium]
MMGSRPNCVVCSCSMLWTAGAVSCTTGFPSRGRDKADASAHAALVHAEFLMVMAYFTQDSAYSYHCVTTV